VLKAWTLALGFAGTLGALGWYFGGYRVAVVVGFFVLLSAVTVHWYGERIVAGLVGAEELPLAEAPALQSTIERLAARARVAPPRLYVMRDGFPRAFAAGRGPGGSAIGVSLGLLQALPPAELDGVLAHELAHIRNRDVLVQTPAVVVAASLVELSRIGGFLSRALLFVLGPVASAFVHAFLSPKREFLADAGAAAICETPHGLADALVRLEQVSELVELEANPATAPLYTLDPFPERGLPALFSTQPPPSERIARLRALDPDWPERLRAA
jgi:heat shock protein HtpX